MRFLYLVGTIACLVAVFASCKQRSSNLQEVDLSPQKTVDEDFVLALKLLKDIDFAPGHTIAIEDSGILARGAPIEIHNVMFDGQQAGTIKPWADSHLGPTKSAYQLANEIGRIVFLYARRHDIIISLLGLPVQEPPVYVQGGKTREIKLADMSWQIESSQEEWQGDFFSKNDIISATFRGPGNDYNLRACVNLSAQKINLLNIAELEFTSRHTNPALPNPSKGNHVPGWTHLVLSFHTKDERWDRWQVEDNLTHEIIFNDEEPWVFDRVQLNADKSSAFWWLDPIGDRVESYSTKINIKQEVGEKFSISYSHENQQQPSKPEVAVNQELLKTYLKRVCWRSYSNIVGVNGTPKSTLIAPVLKVVELTE